MILKIYIHFFLAFTHLSIHGLSISGSVTKNLEPDALTYTCLVSMIILYAVFITRITRELTVHVVQVIMELRCLHLAVTIDMLS